MKHVLKNAGKGALLFLTLLVGQTIGGLIFFRDLAAFPKDGPVGAGEALLIASLIDTVILALLASGARSRGWRLGGTLAILLFGVQIAQPLVETLIFNNDVHMPASIFVATALCGLVRDMIAAGGIALLWRGTSEPAPHISRLGWKVPAIGALYVLCYFTAGQFIAWQSPYVRAYYAHVRPIDFSLVILQFGRGVGWAALAWLLYRNAQGRPWRIALLCGLALSGLMIPLLLFPNPYMPWPVRAVHMVEVGVSNLLFGVLAIWLLGFPATGHQEGLQGKDALAADAA
jgi:hypothetical protein